MKKNKEFYEAALKDLEEKFESNLPDGRYANFFKNPPKSDNGVTDFIKKYFEKKKLYDLIPSWSTNKEVKNCDKINHVFHFIRISLLAVCCNEVGKSGIYFVKPLEDIFHINEYRHLLYPFIPKMERMCKRMRNMSYTISPDALDAIRALKNRVKVAKKESDDEENSASYKITEQDKLLRSLSFDVIFKEVFRHFLDVCELLELTLVSKSFYESIWKYSLGNRNSKSKEFFYFLFSNGREVSDLVLHKFLKYRVIDEEVFTKEFLYPHCFRRRYLRSLKHIIVGSTNTSQEIDRFPFKKLYTTQTDEFIRMFSGGRGPEYYKVVDYRHNTVCSILTCLQIPGHAPPDFKVTVPVEIFDNLLIDLLCFRFDTVLSLGTPLSEYIEFVFTIIRICGVDDETALRRIVSPKKFMKNDKSVLVINPVFQRILERNKSINKDFLKEICKKILDLYSIRDYDCDFSEVSPSMICDTIFRVSGLDPSFEDHYLLLHACEKLNHGLVEFLTKYETIDPCYNDNEPLFKAMNAEAENQVISEYKVVDHLVEKIGKIVVIPDENLVQRWRELFDKCYQKKKYKLVNVFGTTEGLSDLFEVSERMIMDSFLEIRYSDGFPEKDLMGVLPIGMLRSLMNAKNTTCDKNVILDLACEKGMNKVVKVLIDDCGIEPTNNSMKLIVQNDYKQRVPDHQQRFTTPSDLPNNSSFMEEYESYYWKCLKVLLDSGKVDGRTAGRTSSSFGKGQRGLMMKKRESTRNPWRCNIKKEEKPVLLLFSFFVSIRG